MAIYHLCIKIISRGKNKSAVAASAYRSGEKIRNIILQELSKTPKRALMIKPNLSTELRNIIYKAYSKLKKNKQAESIRSCIEKLQQENRGLTQVKKNELDL